MDTLTAPPQLRDRFLDALDGEDQALRHRLAQDLKNCVDRLPGLTCEMLGLPIGSTYGSAARHVLGTTPSQQNASGSGETG